MRGTGTSWSILPLKVVLVCVQRLEGALLAHSLDGSVSGRSGAPGTEILSRTPIYAGGENLAGV